MTGFVPDVTPFFTGCRASIAPLRYGAGVKGKVNLAMSYGLPVVATTPAVEGMHLVPGEDVLVADDAAGVRRRDRPRLSPTRRCGRSCRAAGVANIRKHFSRDVAARALDAPVRARAGVRRRRRATGRPSDRRRAASAARRPASARLVRARRKTRSNTPWPSARPRGSNLVSGRHAGRGAKPSAVFASSGSADSVASISCA